LDLDGLDGLHHEHLLLAVVGTASAAPPWTAWFVRWAS
jgi:hypothetical protein